MIKKLKGFFLTNQTTRQTIAKNTFWLLFGQLFSRFIRVVIVIYGARLLGAEDWGAFSYALGFGTFFTTFIDFGINAVITRESVKDLSKQEKYFATSFFIKVALSAVVALLLALFSPALIKLFAQGADAGKILPLMPFIIGIVIFDGLRDFAATLSRAWEKMEIESLIQVITNATIVGGSFIALAFSKSAQSLAIGYAVGTGIGMIIAFYPFRRYLVDFSKKISVDLIKPIISASWPFGMMSLMGILMLNTDMIVIGWFRSLDVVGYYSAAQKVAQLMQSLPGLIAIAFFPSLAKSAANLPYFKTIVERMMRLLTAVAIPLTIIFIAYAGDIIRILYGAEYDPAMRSFQIFGLTYIASFLTSTFGNAVFALGKEKKLLNYVIFGIAGNFLLDIVLIPRLGASGAALSTAINFNAITLYLYWLLKKDTGIKLLSHFGKIALSSIAMIGIIAIALYANIGIYAGTAAGTAAYVLALWALKEESFMDILHTGRSFVSKKLS